VDRRWLAWLHQYLDAPSNSSTSGTARQR
jgi:hypothetical protein